MECFNLASVLNGDQFNSLIIKSTNATVTNKKRAYSLVSPLQMHTLILLVHYRCIRIFFLNET